MLVSRKFLFFLKNLTQFRKIPPFIREILTLPYFQDLNSSAYFKESSPYFKQISHYFKKKSFQRSVNRLDSTFYDPESFVNW